MEASPGEHAAELATLLPRAFEKRLQAVRKALAMSLPELPFLMRDLRWRRASVGMHRSVPLPRVFEKLLHVVRKALETPLHELPFLMRDLCMEAGFGGHGAERSPLAQGL